MQYIPFILFPIIWIISYKCFSKNKDKIISHLLGFIIGFVALFISAAIFMPAPTPEQIQKRELAKIEQKKDKELQKELKQTTEVKKDIKSIASENAYNVINSLKDNYNIEVSNFQNKKLDENAICTSDKFCEFYADAVQIQFVHKTVTANTSTKVTPKFYQSTCSGILIGLTKMNKELSEDIIGRLFYYASINSTATNEVSNLKINVKPDIGNKLLECSFVKY